MGKEIKIQDCHIQQIIFSPTILRCLSLYVHVNKRGQLSLQVSCNLQVDTCYMNCGGAKGVVWVFSVNFGFAKVLCGNHINAILPSHSNFFSYLADSTQLNIQEDCKQSKGNWTRRCTYGSGPKASSGANQHISSHIPGLYGKEQYTWPRKFTVWRCAHTQTFFVSFYW